mmetsp:Transcript_23420/g.56900  ORF Transcript_23420/g.56900 Transcript_23420/m.56900 type:complete len:275 (+) Transcript_23420:541-1365(+)
MFLSATSSRVGDFPPSFWSTSACRSRWISGCWPRRRKRKERVEAVVSRPATKKDMTTSRRKWSSKGPCSAPMNRLKKSVFGNTTWPSGPGLACSRRCLMISRENSSRTAMLLWILLSPGSMARTGRSGRRSDLGTIIITIMENGLINLQNPSTSEASKAFTKGLVSTLSMEPSSTPNPRLPMLSSVSRKKRSCSSTTCSGLDSRFNLLTSFSPCCTKVSCISPRKLVRVKIWAAICLCSFHDTPPSGLLGPWLTWKIPSPSSSMNTVSSTLSFV